MSNGKEIRATRLGAQVLIRYFSFIGGTSRDAEKETGENDLEPQRETHHAWDHDAQRFFRIERAELADAPVFQTQHPCAGSGQDQQRSRDEADLSVTYLNIRVRRASSGSRPSEIAKILVNVANTMD